MKRSRLRELVKPPSDDTEYIVVDAGGGPGVIALIVSNVLQESLDSLKIAEIYSPHFPQVTLINNDGVAMPPKIDIYVAKPRSGQNRALILITRNFIVDSVEVGEEISELVQEYLSSFKIKDSLFLSSGRINASGEVYASSTDIERVRKLVRLGAKSGTNIDTLPIDRLASSLMLRFHLHNIPMDLLISDTVGFAPDLTSARKVLSIMSGYLNIPIDTSKLDAEIQRQRQLIEEAGKFFETMEKGGGEGGYPSYIG
ncbi:MAG: PAC2 family protein [Nitrososphaerota archaeon]